MYQLKHRDKWDIVLQIAGNKDCQDGSVAGNRLKKNQEHIPFQMAECPLICFCLVLQLNVYLLFHLFSSIYCKSVTAEARQPFNALQVYSVPLVRNILTPESGIKAYTVQNSFCEFLAQ